MSQILGTLQTEKRPPSNLGTMQPKPKRGSSWRDGHARPATRLATCPLTGETRGKKSSHLRSPEDMRFHSTPARNAVDNVARVCVVLLPSTAGISRAPQLGGAAESECSSAIRARNILQSWPLAGEKFLENTFHWFREGFLDPLLHRTLRGIGNEIRTFFGELPNAGIPRVWDRRCDQCRGHQWRQPTRNRHRRGTPVPDDRPAATGIERRIHHCVRQFFVSSGQVTGTDYAQSVLHTSVLICMYLELDTPRRCRRALIWKSRPAPFAFDGKSRLKPYKMCVSR